MQPMKTLAAALAVSTALTASALAATKVGVIGAANPQVIIKSEDGSERVAKVGEDVFLNDELRTNAKGSAQLMFLDKSALTISPESIVTIDKFVYDPMAKDGSMTLNGAKGAFRFIGGALTKKKPVKIKTPVSTIGIRGGIADTHVAAGGKTDAVFLFGKELSVTNGQGQTTSTQKFGTGIGMATANAAPVSLPRAVVTTRIMNSPTVAAVRVAPPASASQISRVEPRVSLNTRSAAPTVTPGANAPGDTADNPVTPNTTNDGGNTPATENDGGTTPAESGANDGAANNTDNDSATLAEGPNDGAQADASASGDDGTGAAVVSLDDGSPDGAGEAFVEVTETGGDVGGGFGEGPNIDVSVETETVTVEVDTGDTNVAQQGLLDNVRDFVETGGDADGDGQLDFDITTALNDNDDDRSIIDRIFGDRTDDDGDGGSLIDQIFADDTTNPDGDPANDGDIVVGDDSTADDGTGDDGTGDDGTADDSSIDDSFGDDTNSDDTPPADDGNTPPAGGGGGGAANAAPESTSATLASGLEYDTTPNDRRFVTITELLSNVTDPDGDTLSIVSGSVSVTSGNGSIVYNASIGGGYDLTVDDVAPGLTETVTIEYDVQDTAGNVITTSQDVMIQGQDFFGGTDAWATTLPTLPTGPESAAPRTLRGQLYYRSDMGTNNTDDDSIRVSKLDAFLGTGDTSNGNYVSRFADRFVFLAEAQKKSTNGSYAGLSMIGTVGAEDYLIGRLNNTHALGVAGFDLLNNQFPNRIEDRNGKLDISNGQLPDYAGFTYVTPESSFHYYQFDWVQEGTPSDSYEYIRAFLMDSPVFDAGGLSAAQAAYDTMITDASSSSVVTPTNGILEYDFLPELATYLFEVDNNGTMELQEFFGPIDYNVESELDGTNLYGASLNENGVFVDWTNKKFLGGYVDFKGDNFGTAADPLPVIRTLFGKVNDGATALNGGGADGLDGAALQGSFYALDQGENFTESGRTLLDVRVETRNVASPGGADNPIEAFVVETRDPGSPGVVKGRQPVVIGDGATAALLDSQVMSSPPLQGFSAGLIIDNGNNVARIKTTAPTDVSINLSGDGSVGATVNYHEADSVGSFSGNSYIVKFGTDADTQTANAAIQKDAYAAEAEKTNGATGPGDTTKGVIVSMHEAVAPTSHDLVCSTCEFAHWGVWQADHISSGNPIERTALVPYVAGEVTPWVDQATWDANQGTLGTVTYSGNAVANMAITPDGGTTQLVNSVGSMSADINLGTRSIAASGLQINFGAIGGEANRALNITNAGAITFDANANMFSGDVGGTFTDAAGNSVSVLPGDNINGALFGPNAEEVGGNFYVQGDTGASGEAIKAGGVFLGKR